MEALFEHGCRPVSSDECGVPECEDAFLAFAKALDISMPKDILSDWFIGINRLRISHRKDWSENWFEQYAAPILGDLIQSASRKWRKSGVSKPRHYSKAAALATIDDVIPLDSENA